MRKWIQESYGLVQVHSKNLNLSVHNPKVHDLPIVPSCFSQSCFFYTRIMKAIWTSEIQKIQLRDVVNRPGKKTNIDGMMWYHIWQKLKSKYRIKK